MQRLTFGEITVDAISDGDLKMPISMALPAADVDAYRRIGGVDSEGMALLPMTTFVIRAAGRIILVDTGLGPELGSLKDMDAGTPVGLMPAALAAAGVPAGSVTDVVLTHLHDDHIGWNARDEGGQRVVTFPNARYIIARTEWESRATVAGKKSIARSLAPLEAGGQLTLVDDGHVVAPGVELLSTPGHTPGHVSVLVMGGGTGGVITGDASHHPGEMEEPNVASVFDSNPEQSTASRIALVARAEAEGLIVMGGHFPPPTAGRIVRVEGRRSWVWLGA